MNRASHVDSGNSMPLFPAYFKALCPLENLPFKFPTPFCENDYNKRQYLFDLTNPTLPVPTKNSNWKNSPELVTARL